MPEEGIFYSSGTHGKVTRLRGYVVPNSENVITSVGLGPNNVKNDL